MDSIVENNKIFAEFMGKVFKGTNPQIIIPEGRLQLSSVKYHSSWNWLMPVVEKIESLSKSTICGRDIYESVTISRNTVEFYFSPENKYKLHMTVANPWNSPYNHTMYKENIIIPYNFQTGSKIEGVYIFVTEFIKWYNKNKKKNELYRSTGSNKRG
jgi:hypothetical protein